MMVKRSMTARAALVVATGLLAATGTASAASLTVAVHPTLAGVVVRVPACGEDAGTGIRVTFSPDRGCDPRIDPAPANVEPRQPAPPDAASPAAPETTSERVTTPPPAAGGEEQPQPPTPQIDVEAPASETGSDGTAEHTSKRTSGATPESMPPSDQGEGLVLKRESSAWSAPLDGPPAGSEEVIIDERSSP